jgi:hypothetical protein
MSLEETTLADLNDLRNSPINTDRRSYYVS